jgi:hypothetical protein
MSITGLNDLAMRLRQQIFAKPECVFDAARHPKYARIGRYAYHCT